MQRQFTIELRVDYTDASKNDDMRKCVTRNARKLLAEAGLLSDGQDPQIIVYSEDFVAGHEDISIMEDALSAAIEEHDGEESGISKDLLDAVNEAAADVKANKA